MSKLILSEAMGNIPDDMLQEAMEVKKQRRIGWSVLRAAACLAVVVGLLLAALGGDGGVVSGSGILAVTVYAADNTPFTIFSPDTVLHNSIYWDGATSASFGCPISLTVSEEYNCLEDITFWITIDGGGMSWEQGGETGASGVAYEIMPAQFVVPNNSTIIWSTFHPNAASDEYSMQHRNTAHVEIVIYDGEIIVGYSVLRLRKMTCSEVIEANPEWIFASKHKECGEEHWIDCYRIEMLESVFFPKIEGEFQMIEEEYVCKQIEKTKLR